MKAYIFPGQGAQFSGMGKSLYDGDSQIQILFQEANDILGFDITSIMFNGTDEELKQTRVTQPAIFLHSVAAYISLGAEANPQMVAGHSLGEFSALVANKVLEFRSALQLVQVRAEAMQRACELHPSTMAAVLGLADEKVEEICCHVANASGEVVVPANYNSPGQIVISGSLRGVELACGQLKDAGAKRAMILPVGGAFHSPLMLPAQEELAAAIHTTEFNAPICPVYQNVVAEPVIEPEKIKENLVRQLTGEVMWTQCVQAMLRDGATEFIECGPGKVLQGLVQKVSKDVVLRGVA